MSNKKIYIIIGVLAVFMALVFILPKLIDGDTPDEGTPIVDSAVIDTIEEYQALIADAKLVYPTANDEFRYNVYTDHCTITEYLGAGGEVVVPDKIDNLPVLAIESEAFTEKPVTSVKISEGVLEIAAHAFEKCESLQSVTVPKSLLIIGDAAFRECTSLATADLSESGVLSIGQTAFHTCSALSEMVLPPKLNTIGTNAFAYCDNLLSIEFPETLLTIPMNCCSSCPNLVSVKINGKESVPEADKNSKDESPAPSRTIEANAFSSCEALANVWIPGDFAEIDSNAFFNASENFVISSYSYSAAAIFAATYRINFTVIDMEKFEEISAKSAKVQSYLASITSQYVSNGRVPFNKVDAYQEALKAAGEDLVAKGWCTSYQLESAKFTADITADRKFTYTLPPLESSETPEQAKEKEQVAKFTKAVADTEAALKDKYPQVDASNVNVYITDFTKRMDELKKSGDVINYTVANYTVTVNLQCGAVREYKPLPSNQ